MTVSLYELSADMRSALEHIDPETGEVDDDLEARLDALGVDIITKMEGVAQYRAGVMAEAEALKVEAARLTKRRHACDANAERMREYIGTCMRVWGEKKVRTSTHTITIQKTPPKVILDIEAGKLGKRWLKAQDPRPDLVGLKKALKAGDDDAGRVAHLEAGESVQVK